MFITCESFRARTFLYPEQLGLASGAFRLALLVQLLLFLQTTRPQSLVLPSNQAQQHRLEICGVDVAIVWKCWS